MSLAGVLKEREAKLKALRQDALEEAHRLVLLLKGHFKFDAIYLHGSILSDRFRRHSDIDMIIKGLKIEDFFKAYALLIKESKYEIDLKPFEDLKEDFKQTVLAKGMKIG